jgi:hypothetical protein
LPNGRRPVVVRVGAAFGKGFQATGFQVGTPEVALTLADETQVPARAVIEKGVQYWKRELAKLGL